MVEALFAGEVDGEVHVVEVERDAFLTELHCGSRLGRVDRKPLAVDVRPARHEEGRAADVDLIAKPVHRPAPRRDAGGVSTSIESSTEESELLAGLNVSERAVLGKMPDLRFGSRGNDDKRQSAQ